MASALAALLLAGCITRPAPVPWPCDTISGVPGLRDEMKALRAADDMRQQLRLEPASVRVRAYAKASSIACAANRVLGAQRVSEPLEQLPWHTRAWRAFVRAVAF